LLQETVVREHFNNAIATVGRLQGPLELSINLKLFPSYETFLGIVTTMVQQYVKFTTVAVEMP